MTVNDLVRTRLRTVQAQRRLTQEAIGTAAGHDQAWVSAWLSGSFEIGLEELDGIARSLNLAITFFFDVPPDADEEDLLLRFRALDAEGRADLLRLLRRLVPDPGPRRTRRRRGE